jgi:photosystem II stability/assembly factor-like uncharacterized protein
VATHPLNPEILYALYKNRTDPIFFSEDGGRTWTNAKGGFISSGDYFPLLFFSKNGDVIYSLAGNVHRSDDSGRQWHHCGQQGSADSFSRVQGSTSAMLVDLTNYTVYAAVSNTGIQITRNKCQSWDHSDRGLSDQFVNTIAIDPNNPKTLYAGTASNGVYISFNSGAYWEPINDGLLNATSVYAIVVDSQSKAYAATSDGLFTLEGK